MTGPHGLERFVEAQVQTYEAALGELRGGRKVGHWMWFIFPQIAGLGHSPTAQFYAIASLEEAREYLAHPILGDRLRQCAHVVNGLSTPEATEIFGPVDALKFRSCMTLFAAADPSEPAFAEALGKFFGGAPDPLTLGRIAG